MNNGNNAWASTVLVRIALDYNSRFKVVMRGDPAENNVKEKRRKLLTKT